MNRLFLYIYIYIYTILYIPGFHVCDYNAQVMEVHIESYFWSWTAFCVWEILSENRKMSSSSGWLLYIDGSNSSYSLRRIYCMLCVYIFVFLFSVGLWVVTLDRIAEFDSLGNRTAEMMWQVWELLTRNAQHKAEKTLYIIISRAFKSINTFFFWKKKCFLVW
jgi:hypothetical protein